MNLGVIYLLSFVLLSAIGALVAFAASMLLSRLTRRVAAGPIFFFVLLGPVMAWESNAYFHRALFTRWHQAQNTIVPAQFLCLEYTPSFKMLKAKYRMTGRDFGEWVEKCPRPLHQETEHPEWLLFKEEEWLGGAKPAAVYQSKIGKNGSGLIACHVNDTAYILYYAF